MPKKKQEKVYLLHFDSRKDSYYRVYATFEGAVKAVKEWQKELYEEDEDEWHEVTSDFWETESGSEFMSIIEMELED